MDKYYINDEKWQTIYTVLKELSGIRVGKEKSTQRFVEAAHFIIKTGCQWRELPSYYGKWRSVHKRYEAWCRKDIWCQVLSYFSTDYDGESILIDATIIRREK